MVGWLRRPVCRNIDTYRVSDLWILTICALQNVGSDYILREESVMELAGRLEDAEGGMARAKNSDFRNDCRENCRDFQK